MKRVWTIIVVSIFLVSASAWAEWKIRYGKDKSGIEHFTAESEEVEVQTLEDKKTKTRMSLIFTCSPQRSEIGLVLFFKDDPKFAPTEDKPEIGVNSFPVITSLHKKGDDKPRIHLTELLQMQLKPKMLMFDTIFIERIRWYDLMTIGFPAWGRDPVIAKVDLRGAAEAMDKAQNRCNAGKSY